MEHTFLFEITQKLSNSKRKYCKVYNKQEEACNQHISFRSVEKVKATLSSYPNTWNSSANSDNLSINEFVAKSLLQDMNSKDLAKYRWFILWACNLYPNIKRFLNVTVFLPLQCYISRFSLNHIQNRTWIVILFNGRNRREELPGGVHMIAIFKSSVNVGPNIYDTTKIYESLFNNKETKETNQEEINSVYSFIIRMISPF